MTERSTSTRPIHGRSQSSGNVQPPVDSARRMFSFLPHRPSEEKVTNKKRKVEANPRGLTELHSPREPQVDFVFVHGLGGGSVRTWCHDEDLNLFWPKAWIGADSDLRDRVRTSTFGYANDWRATKASQLTLHDFGRDLIYQLDNSPYLRKDQRTSIVLVGHSMGGLVIKKACILGYQQQKQIAKRIKCIVFLATPHRGSSAAELLNGLLDLAGWEKKFVEELRRDSSSLQVINDEFRHVARFMDLRLTSLYETQGMVKSRLIVKESSATLGYDTEDVNMVFADHRSICKFKSPKDEDYLSLRNRLLRITDDLTTESNEETLQERVEQMTSIEIYLNIRHRPQIDLDQQCDKQIERSCTWLELRPLFQRWLDGGMQAVSPPTASPRFQKLLRRSTIPLTGRCAVYWLTGNPGAGKSICAAHVIGRLQSQKHECSYHFFQASDKAKTRVSAMLLSIAFQMAELHPSVREALVSLQRAQNSFDEDDNGAVWRKLFVNCIFKAPLRKPQYWVIDAADECSEVDNLFSKLKTIESSFDLRIFVTSRHSSRIQALFTALQATVDTTADSITCEDTKADMQLYLNSRLDCLPVDSPIERQAMLESLLLKASGCFLWLRLVSQELEGVYSENSIKEVLLEVPLEMAELYARSVKSVHEPKRLGERQAAYAVLTWCACAIRPLTLAELTTALNQYDGPEVTELEPSKKNYGYGVTNLKAVVQGPCSGLLHVDGRGCVQFVHATAREYVLTVMEEEFKVNRSTGNQKMTMACLRCLKQELVSARNPSLGGRDSGQRRNRTVFLSYASAAFSEHFAASSSESRQLLRDVGTFLSTTALAWIEYTATEQPSLYPLTRAAKNFKDFLRRRAKREPPLGHDFGTLESWSTDLIRLVAKFGRNLSGNPASIHNLIPLVAPRQSKLSQAAKDGPKWLELVGLASESWDDCVCAIQYRDSWGTCLATGEDVFAIGVKNGTVIVYDQATCQEKFSVKHRSSADSSQDKSSGQNRLPSTVRLLAFDSSDARFASAGTHSICVWSIDGELLRLLSLQEPCVSIKFAADQKELFGIARSSQVTRWSLFDDESDALTIPVAQTRRLSTGSTRFPVPALPRQAPLAATISPDETTLAILYRGRPVYLCSLDDNTVIGICGRDVGSNSPNISVQTALFNPNPELSLLAIAYQDGELAVYDSWTQKELVSVDGDAYSLAATPDGRTLGTGNNQGTINVWDFETLCLLCSIRCGYDQIRSLAFTGNSLRLIDIRDSSAKVWEPSALVRRSTEENASMSDAMPLDPQVVGINEEVVSITVMCADLFGQWTYAGRDDGSVVSYDVGTGLLHSRLYSHSGNLFVSAIACQNGIVGSADAGGRVIVRRGLESVGQKDAAFQLLQLDMAAPVRQLLFKDDGTHLLIATAKSDTFWDLRTGQSCPHAVEEAKIPDTSRRWIKLDQSLGCVSRSSFDLYPWDSMEPKSSTTLQPLHVSHESEMMNWKYEVLAQNHDFRIVVCAVSVSGTSKRSLVGLKKRALENSTDQLQSISSSSSDLEGVSIKMFIGVYATSAVFLDNDLWVCSVKLFEGNWPSKPVILRHFFIPSDFLRESTACKPLLTSKGDIAFAKGSDLAVIKGGLSWVVD